MSQLHAGVYCGERWVGPYIGAVLLLPAATADLARRRYRWLALLLCGSGPHCRTASHGTARHGTARRGTARHGSCSQVNQPLTNRTIRAGPTVDSYIQHATVAYNHTNVPLWTDSWLSFRDRADSGVGEGDRQRLEACRIQPRKQSSPRLSVPPQYRSDDLSLTTRTP